MIYRSNLTCPDLTPHFKHLHVRPMPHSFGHSVPSDWADKADDDPVFGLYKRCGMWTHDEAAILYNVARGLPSGDWLDIGCHTGWTSWHIAMAHRPIRNGNYVHYMDPMLTEPTRAFYDRIIENSPDGKTVPGSPESCTSAEYFGAERMFFINHGGEQCITKRGVPGCFYWQDGKGFERHDPLFTPKFVGVCIDGDHSEGKPLEDAVNASRHLAETGVIIFHDFIGRPVREAVEYLMACGFKCRVYFTPHVVACCWRGDFAPPDHVPDPEVYRQLTDGRMADFNFGACL